MENVKLQHFRDAMKDFSEDYILIGGNACALFFDSVGAKFRETADLDIVLVIENWSAEFAKALDQYIVEGGYRGRRFTRGDDTGKSSVHRFQINKEHPRFDEIPSEIELFSRCPDGITLEVDEHLVPIEPVDGVSNFSAILFNDDYYAHLKGNTVIVEGIQIPNLKCLTALKASAWINNRDLFGKKKINDIGTVHKHAFDICRLFAIYDDKDFKSSKVPSRILEDIELVSKWFSEQPETEVLDAFLADTTAEELPIAYSDASEFLNEAFEA
ncbi:hypothetical protein [Vibrio splendidus]|uniref:Nucleotidyl transferase AbiEii/AbiGii toxin family protein n=1 Tax=Vibrio splendidus TaxID=29497 RepID=A0A2N7JKF2_VIBSP|nr:hypothetical protein [Vibrio splendidus]PMM41198.1 hypothetical protein BCT54_10770 [Vibrio splendidus]